MREKSLIRTNASKCCDRRLNYHMTNKKIAPFSFFLDSSHFLLIPPDFSSWPKANGNKKTLLYDRRELARFAIRGLCLFDAFALLLRVSL